MISLRKALTIATVTSLIAAPLLASSDVMQAVKARQDLMKAYGKNIAMLGSMAQGKVAYDPVAATAAAAEIVRLSEVDQSGYWPEGSDNFELSEDQTRAMPEVWDDLADLAKKTKDVNAVAVQMEIAAGENLDALRGALGPLGLACTACHKPYRAPKQ
jgi:cytochrome c556